jgi:hypothetical protein
VRSVTMSSANTMVKKASIMFSGGDVDGYHDIR